MATPNEGFVKCSTCGVEKPTAEITLNSLKSGNNWKQCRSCYRAYMVVYRNKTREAYNEYQRQWRKPIQERLNAKWRARRKRLISAMTPDELSIFRREQVEETSAWNRKLKDQVFAAYGGYKCACCGETEKLFLTMDHVFNNGAEQKRSGVHGRNSASFYRWLRKSNFPEGYQVLCMNCNFGKHMNKGVCPHKATCNDHSVMEVGSSEPKRMGPVRAMR